MAHRHCVVSLSDWSSTLQQFEQHYGTFSDALVISHSTLPLTHVSQINFNTLKRQLGNSYSAVLLDLSKGINITALSIVAGTIRGGGVFVLHLGEDWLIKADQELDRYLPWPLNSQDTTSVYKTIFWQALNQDSSPFQIAWPDSIQPSTYNTKCLTPEQEHFVDSVLLHPTTCHFLLAPRGRGKSFALAELIVRAQSRGIKSACTASSKLNMTSLSDHYQDLTESLLPFKAPDALLNDTEKYDLLVIDEAASLPLPVLESLIEKADSIVFSSTDYGYEGSGKGFAIRFQRLLENRKVSVLKHQFTHPIRWGKNDPLENWLDQLLFKEYQAHELSQVQPSQLCREDWLNCPAILDQAFSLLVNAHYQTSPENKRWMVDDPSVKTYCLYHEKRLIGVALVSVEGNLPNELSQAVMEGTRRPRGHLLPQSLLAHEGISEAAQYTYWRISRIAIASGYQRQGFGRRLLQLIEQDALENKAHFIATSFAATADVINFWRDYGLITVRLGTGKDQASGAYSLMMVKGLTPAMKSISQGWSNLFKKDWLDTLTLSLRELSPELILSINATFPMGENPHILKPSSKDVSDLAYFCDHHRPFDAIRPALLRLTMQRLQQGKLLSNSVDDRLLLGCAINVVTEKDAQKLGFSGKKVFYQQLKHIISLHLN